MFTNDDFSPGLTRAAEADMTLYGQRRELLPKDRSPVPINANPPGWVHPKPFPARSLDLGPHQGFRRRSDGVPGTAPTFPPPPSPQRAVPGRPIARIGPDGRVTLIYPADPLHSHLHTKLSPAVREGISHHWSIPNVGRRALHHPPPRLYLRAGRQATVSRARQQVSSFVARKPVHSTRFDRRIHAAAQQGGQHTPDASIAIPTG
ncbi:uncharacterized protein LOC118412666 [Branchiostoma floridae]|uniref:Uncharacterized protein LOC118412666 n=1 Tax=Branchiostoma floridae TaxID=7739 RepID=A0A9J7KXJ7_BRAFL|nr:uncharacterized protein LOC118412666 [Branchiostoma floridae]